jgi:hypothetical protein
MKNPEKRELSPPSEQELTLNNKRPAKDIRNKG